jgi:hypothetical protein
MTYVIWMQLAIIFWLLVFRRSHAQWLDIPVVLILFFGSAMLVEGTLCRWKAKKLEERWPGVPLSNLENLLFGAVGTVVFGVMWYFYREVIFPLLLSFYRWAVPL